MSLEELSGTSWRGEYRLWLEPGSEAQVSEGTMQIEGDQLRYTWAYQGEPQQGTIDVAEDGSARWTDSWHQADKMSCRAVEGPGALLSVLGAYAAPPDADWHWRTLLCRPSGELVLQMTNITSWGEEAPAVLMVCSPA